MKPLQLFIKTLALLSLLSMSIYAATADSITEKKQQQFVELLPKDFRPAFTRDTVITLNAIVRRSYDVINEYDTIIEKARRSATQVSNTDSNKTLESMTEKNASEIQALEQRSSHALSDMMSAVKTLKESGEEYNKAVLAGMVNFVKDVNEEITKKNAEMTALINEV